MTKPIGSFPANHKKKSHDKTKKPSASKKKAAKDKLVAKGIRIDPVIHITGIHEDIDAKEIARRRIEWQKSLPKDTGSEVTIAKNWLLTQNVVVGDVRIYGWKEWECLVPHHCVLPPPTSKWRPFQGSSS